MKTTFLCHTQPGPRFCPHPKGLNIRNSLDSILIFNQLKRLKTEASSIITNFVTFRLTKVKFLKIISFMPFLIQIGHFFYIHVIFLTILAKLISTQMFVQPLALLLSFQNVFTMQNIKKPRLLLMRVFVHFFQNIGPNLAQIQLKTTPTLFFS